MASRTLQPPFKTLERPCTGSLTVDGFVCACVRLSCVIRCELAEWRYSALKRRGYGGLVNVRGPGSPAFFV